MKKKILILALSGIGDALMFTPAIHLIRKHFPDAQIDALVMYKGVKDIYERTKLLDNIIFFEFLKNSKMDALTLVLSLRNKYTHSINVYPSNRKEYNIISFLIGAKSRAAVSYLRMNTSELGWLNNIKIKENDELHNVSENILLTKKLLNFTSDEEPPLIFNLFKEDIDFADRFIADNKLPVSSAGTNKKLIGFHPGCSTLKNHINRRWSPQNFGTLAKLLIDNLGVKVLVFGGPDEIELKNRVKQAADSPDCIIINTNNLGETAALISKCSLFITNDSSLMHVSASQGVFTIPIIGPTNRNYIHPWKTKYEIISLNLGCSPCFYYSPKPLECKRSDIKYKCIKEITPEIAYKKIREIID